MSTHKSCFQFEFEDFFDELPDPGLYRARIKTARFRRSTHGNQMLQVIYVLDGVKPIHQLIADYFVLEGEAVSASAIFLARRRLVQLYNACRIFPKEGDEIDPALLVGGELRVQVEHESWQGHPRLRVVACLPLQELSDSEEEIPF